MSTDFGVENKKEFKRKTTCIVFLKLQQLNKMFIFILNVTTVKFVKRFPGGKYYFKMA